MYTIGSDPEFFVIRDDKIRYPAYKIINGTKENPTDLKDGYNVLYDNVLIEGNIPPTDSLKEFITNMRIIKIKMNNILKHFSCKILESDVENFDDIDLIDDKAREFGCVPFMDAWTFEEVIAPVIDENFRTAGFHIHVGYENISKYPKEVVNIAIARAFDYFVTLPAKLYHHDNRRDRSYGGFGKFRHKPYGLELRSLSGYFAQDCYLEWVYNQTIKAVDFVLKHNLVEDFLELEKSNLTIFDADLKLGITIKENLVHKSLLYPEPKKLVT